MTYSLFKIALTGYSLRSFFHSRNLFVSFLEILPLVEFMLEDDIKYACHIFFIKKIDLTIINSTSDVILLFLARSGLFAL